MSTITPSSPPAAKPSSKFGNAEEWHHALGDVPLSRIVFNPPPSTATEQDLLYYVERDKLIELVDGTLVQKPVGWLESLIAMRLGIALGAFVEAHRLGVVLGADATFRMAGGRIRLPDITFVGLRDLPGGGLPTDRIPLMSPTLAIEVVSKGNTPDEMRQKRKEYFESGASLVWLVYPESRSIEIYSGPTDGPDRVVRENETLDGGQVIPGFTLVLSELFRSQP